MLNSGHHTQQNRFDTLSDSNRVVHAPGKSINGRTPSPKVGKNCQMTTDNLDKDSIGSEKDTSETGAS
jgi:hypothetical protein